MSYHLLKPNKGALSKSGYASVSHIPFLIRDDGIYPALANRYLRARALLEWPLRLGTSSEPIEPTRRFQTLTSCIGLVRRLKQLLEWIDTHDIDLATVNYQDLLGWQDGLLNGRLSASGEALRPSTVNLYASEACYYLTWLSLVPRDDRGRPVRGPFEVAIAQHRLSKKDHEYGGAVRVGHLQQQPRRAIHLPSYAEVAQWMRAFRVRAEVKALMAEVILDSGMRISEVNQMDVDTLPERCSWRSVGGRIHFWISNGVKGAKTAPDSNVAVHAREISLARSVAEKVDRYRSFARETQLRRWIRAGRNKAEQARRAKHPPKRLWLSETSNMPFDNQQLRHAWTTTAHCPKGWHPHRGREWFAVEMLVTFAQNAHAARHSDIPDFAWLDSVMRNQIDLLIRPALGHLSVRTTELYLRAARYRLEQLFEEPSLRWQISMDAGDDDTDPI